MRRRRGFTVAELMVAVAAMALMLSAVVLIFRQNLDQMKRGDEEMFLQAEAARLLTEIYFDLTSINPRPYLDRGNDLWIAGERTGEVDPNFLRFGDHDGRTDKGFDRLSWTDFAKETLTDAEPVEYYLDPDPTVPKTFRKNAEGVAHILKRRRGGREVVVSENVVRCDFTPVDDVVKAVVVDGEVALRSKNGPVKTLPFRFRVTLESPYLAFRF